MLPDVGSTIVPPGCRSPSRSAASIIAIAGRSFTEPPGLNSSTLAIRSHCELGADATQPHHRRVADEVEQSCRPPPLGHGSGASLARGCRLASCRNTTTPSKSTPRRKRSGKSSGTTAPTSRRSPGVTIEILHPGDEVGQRTRASLPLPRAQVPGMSGGVGPIVGVGHRGEAVRVVEVRRDRQAAVVEGRGVHEPHTGRPRPRPASTSSSATGRSTR